MIIEYRHISLGLWESAEFSYFREEMLKLGWKVEGYSEFYFDGTEYKPKYVELRLEK